MAKELVVMLGFKGSVETPCVLHDDERAGTRTDVPSSRAVEINGRKRL
jgi:hypothetical protein